jgi:hypothetical protein
MSTSTKSTWPWSRYGAGNLLALYSSHSRRTGTSYQPSIIEAWPELRGKEVEGDGGGGYELASFLPLSLIYLDLLRLFVFSLRTSSSSREYLLTTKQTTSMRMGQTQLRRR